MRLAPTAGVVARDGEGHILLVRRGDDGTWGVPGGHVEVGESWQECAEREFTEETGASARIEGVLGIYSDPDHQRHHYPDGRHVQFVGVVFEGTIRGAPDDVVPPTDGEITECRWFLPEELPSRIFDPDRPVLADATSPEPRPFIR